MHYTEVLNAVKTASLFDLYRLSIAIKNEMEKPDRIQQLRETFAEGDTVSYFSAARNTLQQAVVIQKNTKTVLVQNLSDQQYWKIAYYALNLAKTDVDIYVTHQETLSKNHLKVGEFVGFNKDGKTIYGVVIRLNQKTITLMTKNKQRWRVSYNFVFSVVEAEIIKQFDPKLITAWVRQEEQRIEQPLGIEN